MIMLRNVTASIELCSDRRKCKIVGSLPRYHLPPGNIASYRSNLEESVIGISLGIITPHDDLKLTHLSATRARGLCVILKHHYTNVRLRGPVSRVVIFWEAIPARVSCDRGKLNSSLP